MPRRTRTRVQPIPCKKKGCPGIAAWEVTVGKKTEKLCHEHRNDVIYTTQQEVSEKRIKY